MKALLPLQAQTPLLNHSFWNADDLPPAHDPGLSQILKIMDSALCVCVCLCPQVALLASLHHPNIVRYVGTSRQDNALYIFMEFIPVSVASVHSGVASAPGIA